MKVRIKLISRKKKRSRAGREDAKRFASRVTTGVVIAGVVVALVMVANRWAKKEELRSFRIIGRTILDSAEIMTQAAVPDSIPLQALDLTAVERRVAAHPFIERASVYRGENGTLVVEITERAPVAVTLVDGAPLYLDSLGVPLPYRFSSAGFDLPVLSGIVRELPSDSVAKNDAPPAAERLDSVRGREALGVVTALRGYDDGLYRQISEVRREPSGEYTFVTSDGGVPVRAGYAAEIPARLRKLDLFMTTALATKGAGRARSIDLRWKGQVVVRWRGETPREPNI